MSFQEMVVDLEKDFSGSLIYEVNQLRLRLLSEAQMLTMSECSAVAHEIDQLRKAMDMVMFSGTVKKWIEEREGA